MAATLRISEAEAAYHPVTILPVIPLLARLLAVCIKHRFGAWTRGERPNSAILVLSQTLFLVLMGRPAPLGTLVVNDHPAVGMARRRPKTSKLRFGASGKPRSKNGERPPLGPTLALAAAAH